MPPSMIVDHEDIRPETPTELIGGKAANLGVLHRAGYSVPPFFVITTEAFCHAIVGSKPKDGAEMRRTIGALQLDPTLFEQINQHFEQYFPPDRLVAVRSSAPEEDSQSQSFAGMHDSFLFVRGPEDLLSAIRNVWASAFSQRALAYRASKKNVPQGISVGDISIAVVVQEMIDPRRSGVMFTCNPANSSANDIVVSSLWGAGEGLVSAGFDADTFTFDRKSQAITRQIGEKREQLIFDQQRGTGLITVPVPPERQMIASCTDDQLNLLADAGEAIERLYGRPQDIEFCFGKDDRLHILQSRPVTNLDYVGPAAGNHLIWDNSNIIESYSGVTTPMTFSFILRAYAIVYHCFADVMGISPKTVQANRDTFENMIGLIRGRVYYNLKNWYRLIRMFPGFQTNSQFLESMMGLKETLDLGETARPAGLLRRWFVELPKLARLLLRTSWNFFHIQNKVDAFQNNFHKHYDQWQTLDLDQLRPHEMMALYHKMEDALLWNWKAPIINDFYVMIYCGLLKKVCSNWCSDESGSLRNDLLTGEGGVESVEPTRMLLRMAAFAQQDPALRDLILNEPPESLPDQVANDERFSAFHQQMVQYLDLFGFRCMNELKLEEFSLRDRPHLVYQVLRNYLALDDSALFDVDAAALREQKVRLQAEQTAQAAIRSRWTFVPRKMLFRRILKRARMGVKNRENMRFARTRIYGFLREMLRSVGRQLAADGILENQEDIFYLTIDEVWNFVKGTAVSCELRSLAAVRRAEYDRYRDESSDVPADRFDTYGMVYHRNSFTDPLASRATPTDGKLTGLGCCPGQVEQTAIVLRSATEDIKLSREILVAERTDPGWVPLYPTVSGILIERGSILSHSAVVAREMGIPTIVGITGLLKSVRTGDRLRMDGRAGTVEVLSRAAHSTPGSKVE